MKRIVASVAIALAFLAIPAVGAVPVKADTSTSNNCVNGGPGTYTCTIHMSQAIDMGPGCGTADLVIDASGVFHETINQNGSWFTGTLQGPATGYDGGGNVMLTGHAQSWFGDENNLQNEVQHFTTNISGKLMDGTPVGAHLNGQFTVNANGQLTASHLNVS
ncbi:MAG TPA: hypothetical protein VF898_04175, partial [Chloroflexota bacterium]